MRNSDYINRYLKQSAIEQRKKGNPVWMKSFFKVFSKKLKERCANASPGDRYTVVSSFKSAFEHLLPNGVDWDDEVALEKLVSIKGGKEVDKMLMKKRIDFVVYCKKKTVLIELKTNLQFNDLSAAMMEMGAMKKYKPLPSVKRITTASLHLFPFITPIQGLKQMNEMFNSPLDNIWIFCRGPELVFDLDQIKKFRNDLRN